LSRHSLSQLSRWSSRQIFLIPTLSREADSTPRKIPLRLVGCRFGEPPRCEPVPPAILRQLQHKEGLVCRDVADQHCQLESQQRIGW